MSDLLPCPFCGGSDVEVSISDLVQDTLWMSCNGCHGEGPIEENEAEAIAAWNARAESAELARLRAVIAEFVDVAEDVVDCSPIEENGRLVCEKDIARLHALVLRHATPPAHTAES